MKIRHLTETLDRGLRLLALLNVDNHLGDVVDEVEDSTDIKPAVWGLAHDAVIDGGGSPEDATRIANQIARGY